MEREIEFFEMRNIKISGEVFSIYKFKEQGKYTDGNGNDYIVYTTELENKKVTFLKNKFSLLCTDRKEYFEFASLKKGDLDFYNWEIVTV